MAKEHKMFSLDTETIERLEQYAKEHHISSLSQAITFLIWSRPLPCEIADKCGTCTLATEK